MQATEFYDGPEDEAELQLRADGSLRHSLTLKGLDREMLIRLLDHAEGFPTPMGGYSARTNALADSDRSVIEEQVTSGVAVRMAVLEHVCKGRD